MDELLREIVKNRGIYLFLLPTFILVSIFSYYPIISAVFHAFTEWDGVNVRFNGIKNFASMPKDDALVASIPNVIRLALFAEFVALTLPLLAAVIIFHLKGEKIRYFFRVLFVVPMVVPYMVILLIWRFIYDPMDGLLNRLLMLVGFKDPPMWLGDPKTALLSIMLIGFPWVAGFNLLIYIAGLDNISPDIFDAATIDGATGFRRFFSIELPLLSGQIKLIVIMTFITQLQAFQSELILTNGGPGFSTMVPGLVLYQNAFHFNRMGYASAIGLLLALFILILTIFSMKYISTEVGTIIR